MCDFGRPSRACWVRSARYSGSRSARVSSNRLYSSGLFRGSLKKPWFLRKAAAYAPQEITSVVMNPSASRESASWTPTKASFSSAGSYGKSKNRFRQSCRLPDAICTAVSKNRCHDSDSQAMVQPLLHRCVVAAKLHDTVALGEGPPSTAIQCPSGSERIALGEQQDLQGIVP